LTGFTRCRYRTSQGEQCVLGYDHNFNVDSVHRYPEVDPAAVARVTEPYRLMLQKVLQQDTLRPDFRDQITDLINPQVERTITIRVKGRPSSVNRWLNKVKKTIHDHQHIDGTVEVVEDI
jgi:hypothetical protein